MSPKDIVITSALRTPFTKALKGGLARTPPSVLLTHVLKATQSSIKPYIEDVYVGNSAGLSFADVLKECGFPKATQISTISHAQLSSAIPTTFLAASIRTGAMTCGIVAGVESATKDYPRKHSAGRKILGVTAEQEKDYTDRSYGAAVKAFEDGLWLDMTVPVSQNVHATDETDRTHEEWMRIELQDRIQEAQQREVDVDEGYVSTPVDGAAAVVLMTRDKAAEIGVRPIGRLIDSEVVEDIDDVVDMLRDAGISKDDVDVWEIHESSARDVIDLMHKLHVSPTTVNPNGGALALGDPFGAAGARLLGNALASLRDIDGKYGVVLIPSDKGELYAGVLSLH
ncbi:thiolase-like protein [Lipomyces kononenkoae]|uniref:Thiolase-like protein n=1 Tax=Lipomyces kononenkoae TaxID=34357 RepID=A0ACC3SZZ5_LIPKO